MADQFTFQDPTTQYDTSSFTPQSQGGSGLAKEMDPPPDHGEQTYRGTGRLTGRKAIVTGADSGIGRAVAIAYAREGADVVLSYLPDEQPDADEVIALIEKEGRKAVALPGDLKDEAYCQSLVDTAVSELGGLDLLASIAGKQQFQTDIADITTEQFDETMKTNIYAMFWLCKAAVAVMPPGSTIINTGSLVAYMAPPILLDYSTTKGAINTFSKSLAQQVASKGIRVNVVAPGPVWTPLQVAGGQPPEALESDFPDTPLGRAGMPSEMAPAYVYFASQESSFVTGATLSLNGGTPTP